MREYVLALRGIYRAFRGEEPLHFDGEYYKLSLLPAMPVSGSGDAVYEPIWARDVARCVSAALNGGGSEPDRRRFELAGPQILSYDGIVGEVLEALGRPRPLLHVPLPIVRALAMILMSGTRGRISPCR